MLLSMTLGLVFAGTVDAVVTLHVHALTEPPDASIENCAKVKLPVEVRATMKTYVYTNIVPPIADIPEETIELSPVNATLKVPACYYRDTEYLAVLVLGNHTMMRELLSRWANEVSIKERVLFIGGRSSPPRSYSLYPYLPLLVPEIPAATSAISLLLALAHPKSWNDPALIAYLAALAITTWAYIVMLAFNTTPTPFSA